MKQLYQPLTFQRVLTVVTTTTLTIVLRGLSDNQSDFNCIPQSNQTVRQFRRSVESLNLVPKMS
jgi:hypothetical protein